MDDGQQILLLMTPSGTEVDKEKKIIEYSAVYKKHT